jgi:hypothetical protein
MLPTIHMPEPMQEPVPAFGIGGLAATCSATECCCCTILSVTSAEFAAAFLSFSGALLLKNIVHLRFRRHAVQKGPKGCRAATSRKRMAFKLGCRLRIGLRKPELPLRWSLRVRAIPCTVPCQGFHFPKIRALHRPSTLSLPSPYPATVCEEKLGQL